VVTGCRGGWTHRRPARAISPQKRRRTRNNALGRAFAFFLSIVGDDAHTSKGDESMKARVTIGTMVATATLMVGLLGGGVANAGNFCVNACKAKKTAGMTECVQLGSGCNVVYRTCKKTCRQETFGDDRKVCYEECDRGKVECKDYRDACKDDCSIDFLECKAQCVALGF
jgi:hypothetical protein